MLTGCIVSTTFAFIVIYATLWYRIATHGSCLSNDDTLIDYVGEKRSIASSLHDTESLDVLMEDPELYYEEETGRYIWASESTAPRDALSRGDMHAWLHVIVEGAQIDSFIRSFHTYLGYYVAQGIEMKRVIVDVHLSDGRQAGDRSLASLIAMVEHVCAEYTVSYIAHSSAPIGIQTVKTNDGDNHDRRHPEYPSLIATLVSMDGIPLHDWIICVKYDRRIFFGGGIRAMKEFMETNERNGANCAVTKHIDGNGNWKSNQYVAMKAYLRANVNRTRVFDLQEAEDYFGDAFEYMYTPYTMWWEFYKSKKVLGNAYLWYPRVSDDPLTEQGHMNNT